MNMATSADTIPRKVCLFTRQPSPCWKNTSKYQCSMSDGETVESHVVQGEQGTEATKEIRSVG